MMDTISAQKYYPNEVLSEKYLKLYGIWKVTGTSGGFTGMGYKADFDYLLMKPCGIFGIIRNDSLVATGKILIIDQSDKNLRIDFVSEKDHGKLRIEMLQDSEKNVEIDGDSLSLNAPCCDRFNTHLTKLKP